LGTRFLLADISLHVQSISKEMRNGQVSAANHTSQIQTTKKTNQFHHSSTYINKISAIAKE